MVDYENFVNTYDTESLKSHSVGRRIGGMLSHLEDYSRMPDINCSMLRSILGEFLQYKKLLIIGGESSAGKTTFICQCVLDMCMNGNPVIYISLEMDEIEITSKILSLMTFQADKANAVTARQIMDFKTIHTLTDKQRDNLQAQINALSQLNNLFIIEGDGSLKVDGIRNICDRYCKLTGTAPVLIIDYLQILPPLNDKATDKQSIDCNVVELKRIARDYEIPVIAISSFNRASYMQGATMAAFKESGSIEYSADILLSLNYRNIDKTTTEKDEKQKNPRELKITVLKNRTGEVWRETDLDYYPKYNCFEIHTPFYADRVKPR